MKKAALLVCAVLGLVGCATPQQNAALAGAAAGALIGAAIHEQNSQHRHPPVYHHPRPIHCSTVAVHVGYDIYGRPVYQHRRVCR